MNFGSFCGVLFVGWWLDMYLEVNSQVRAFSAYRGGLVSGLLRVLVLGHLEGEESRDSGANPNWQNCAQIVLRGKNLGYPELRAKPMKLASASLLVLSFTVGILGEPLIVVLLLSFASKVARKESRSGYYGEKSRRSKCVPFPSQDHRCPCKEALRNLMATNRQRK